MGELVKEWKRSSDRSTRFVCAESFGSSWATLAFPPKSDRDRLALHEPGALWGASFVRTVGADRFAANRGDHGTRWEKRRAGCKDDELENVDLRHLRQVFDAACCDNDSIVALSVK